MKERLKILVFSILAAGIFGTIDYLFGLFYAVYENRAEGVAVLVSSFLAGQLLYFSIGAGSGVIAILSLSIFRGVSQGGKPAKISLSGDILGIMAGIFVLLLAETYAQPHSDWKLFLDFAFCFPFAVAAGYGLKVFWVRYLRAFLGTAMSAIFILYVSTVLACMACTLWVLKLPVSTAGKFLMLLAAGGIFAVSIYLGRFSFKAKTVGPISTYAVFALVCLALPVYSYSPPAKYPRLGAAKNPVNVILIISDACRSDALGVYGGNNQTPNIDQLAREGVVFKNAFSQAPWTLPSMLSIMSSLNPSIFRYGEPYRAGPEIEFFPERLKGYGYNTKAVMANFLLAGSSGILQGLDKTSTIRHRFRLQKLVLLPVTLKTWYLICRFLKLPQLPDNTAMITSAGEKYLANPPQPFFLWLHYMNPHDPYNPPPKYLDQISYKGFLRPPFFPNDPFHILEDQSHPQEMELRLGYVFLHNKDKQYLHDLYLAQLRYLDEKVGELMKDIKARGLEKNTVIVFASDHGEEFWEHDQQGHGCGLYDELIHVPLIIWGAGIQPGVVEQQVQMLDLVPTLAEMLGISPNPVWQGKSFYATLKPTGQSFEPHEAFAGGMHRPEDMEMIRTGDYKYIIGLYTGKHWLFNLKQDPEEQKNIFNPDLTVVKDLEKKLTAWNAQNSATRAKFKTRALSPEEEKEIEERLRTAGYVK